MRAVLIDRENRYPDPDAGLSDLLGLATTLGLS